MKKVMVKSIVALGLMLSMNVTGAEIIKTSAPDPEPPVVVGPQTPKPGTGYKWIDGHWKWVKEVQKYVWINPAWVKVPTRFAWIKKTWDSIPQVYKQFPWKKKTQSPAPGGKTEAPAPTEKTPDPTPAGKNPNPTTGGKG